MRYYSTSSATITVIRRLGYYPSYSSARRLSTKLAYVLGDENRPALIKALFDGLACGLPFGISMQEQNALLRQDHNFLRENGDLVSEEDLKEKFRKLNNFWGSRVELLRLMSSEQRLIQELLDWWTADKDEPKLLAEKAYICANLNQGRTLVVIERSRKEDLL